MTIYVDCDDTLVVWDDHAIFSKDTPFNEWSSTDWKFNENIVEFLERCYQESIPVVIWTGGGQAYAALWFNRLERHVGHALYADFMAKTDTTMKYVTCEDVCIDDMPIKVVGLLIEPW